MLEVIDEEADRLNRFVEGLVELARIEAGELHGKARAEVLRQPRRQTHGREEGG